MYYVARCNGVGFKFIHTAGFDIRDYLIPNKADWSAELTDITQSPFEKKELEYRPPFAGLTDLKSDMQYICRNYIGKNIIEMGNVSDWQRIWRELFWDLFTPSSALTEALDEYKMPERYSVVNARFINSLGMFEDASYNSPLPENIRDNVIEKVLIKVRECEKDSDVPVIVYSDSVLFLQETARRGFWTCDLQGIGHIMNPDCSEEVYLKTFVNFFQIANAEKIYSILNVDGIPENTLYRSQYPRYAAIIGDKPFIRL